MLYHLGNPAEVASVEFLYEWTCTIIPHMIRVQYSKNWSSLNVLVGITIHKRVYFKRPAFQVIAQASYMY